MGSLSLSVGRKQSATSTGGMCETILKKSSKKRTWHHPSPLLAYAHMFRRIYRRQGEREGSNRQPVRSNQLRALDGESGHPYDPIIAGEAFHATRKGAFPKLLLESVNEVFNVYAHAVADAFVAGTIFVHVTDFLANDGTVICLDEALYLVIQSMIISNFQINVVVNSSMVCHA